MSLPIYWHAPPSRRCSSSSSSSLLYIASFRVPRVASFLYSKISRLRGLLVGFKSLVSVPVSVSLLRYLILSQRTMKHCCHHRRHRPLTPHHRRAEDCFWTSCSWLRSPQIRRRGKGTFGSTRYREAAWAASAHCPTGGAQGRCSDAGASGRPASKCRNSASSSR